MPSESARPRAAARQAKAAQYWGDRRKQAEKEGPEATFATAVDQLRSTIRRVRGDSRPAVYAAATKALDEIRQSLAES